MNFKQLLSAAIPGALLMVSVSAMAYDLPEELTYHNKTLSDNSDMDDQSLSNDRVQFASGGFLVGALAGGPVGAFAGTIIGDLWAQDKEQSLSLKQQVSFWKQQAMEQKHELAALKQASDDFCLQKVSFQQVTPMQDEHLALLAWSLNSSIHFTTNSQQLEQHYVPKLKRLVYLLNHYPHINIHLSGFSDYRGQEKNNQALSQKRAEAIRDYLVQSGIKSERINIKAYGEQQPLYSQRKIQDEHKQSKRMDDQLAFERRVDISFTQAGHSIVNN